MNNMLKEIATAGQAFFEGVLKFTEAITPFILAIALLVALCAIWLALLIIRSSKNGEAGEDSSISPGAPRRNQGIIRRWAEILVKFLL